MHKKFEIDQKKIKGSCQLGRKVITHDSKSDLPLIYTFVCSQIFKGEGDLEPASIYFTHLLYLVTFLSFLAASRARTAKLNCFVRSLLPLHST